MYLIPIYWFVALTPIVVFTIAFFVVRRRGKSNSEAFQIGCFWFCFGLFVAMMAVKVAISQQLVPAHWIIP